MAHDLTHLDRYRHIAAGLDLVRNPHVDLHQAGNCSKNRPGILHDGGQASHRSRYIRQGCGQRQSRELAVDTSAGQTLAGGEEGDVVSGLHRGSRSVECAVGHVNCSRLARPACVGRKDSG